MFTASSYWGAGNDRCWSPAVPAVPTPLVSGSLSAAMDLENGLTCASVLLNAVESCSSKSWPQRLAYQTRVSASYWVSSEAADCICGVSTSSRCPECVSQTVSFGTRLDDRSGLVCRRQRRTVGEPFVGCSLRVGVSGLRACPVGTVFSPLYKEPPPVNVTSPVNQTLPLSRWSRFGLWTLSW